MSSIWTKPELLEQIALWKKAYAAVSAGQSYTIGGRSLTRVDADKIFAQIKKLQNELAELETGSGPWLGRAVFRRPGR